MDQGLQRYVGVRHRYENRHAMISLIDQYMQLSVLLLNYLFRLRNAFPASCVHLYSTGQKCFSTIQM